jgi:hypothetical protein
MSQKSSVPQAISFVSQVLKRDRRAGASLSPQDEKYVRFRFRSRRSLGDWYFRLLVRCHGFMEIRVPSIQRTLPRCSK